MVEPYKLWKGGKLQAKSQFLLSLEVLNPPASARVGATILQSAAWLLEEPVAHLGYDFEVIIPCLILHDRKAFPACLWKRRTKIMPSISLCLLWIIVPHSFLNHTTQIGKLLGNSCFQRSPWPSPKTWMSSSTGLGGREVCTEHASSSSASDTFGTVAKQSSGEGAFMCWKWGLVFLSWYHNPLYSVIQKNVGSWSIGYAGCSCWSREFRMHSLMQWPSCTCTWWVSWL